MLTYAVYDEPTYGVYTSTRGISPERGHLVIIISEIDHFAVKAFGRALCYHHYQIIFWVYRIRSIYTQSIGRGCREVNIWPWRVAKCLCATAFPSLRVWDCVRTVAHVRKSIFFAALNNAVYNTSARQTHEKHKYTHTHAEQQVEIPQHQCTCRVLQYEGSDLDFGISSVHLSPPPPPPDPHPPPVCDIKCCFRCSLFSHLATEQHIHLSGNVYLQAVYSRYSSMHSIQTHTVTHTSSSWASQRQTTKQQTCTNMTIKV